MQLIEDERRTEMDPWRLTWRLAFEVQERKWIHLRYSPGVDIDLELVAAVDIAEHC